MDFLNKSIAQLNDLFRSMSPGARITSGLLLVVVLVSLVFLFRFETSSPDDYLLAGHMFSSRELNAAIGALSPGAAFTIGNVRHITNNKLVTGLSILANNGVINLVENSWVMVNFFFFYAT